MLTPTPTSVEALRAQAEATRGLARRLRGEALAGPVVLQPSAVSAVEAAVTGARELEPLARDAGLSRELAEVFAAAHVLHYELSNRLRDAEDLRAGTDVVQLIQALDSAAERLALAAGETGPQTPDRRDPLAADRRKAFRLGGRREGET